jgi:multiple sugar transport system substrate-binding protein
MKRTWLAIAASATALVTAACSGGGTNTSAQNTHKVVLWYGWKGAEGSAFKSLVADYNRTHQTGQIDAEFIGSNKVALEKVLTGIRGGSYPDIVYLWGSLAGQVDKLPVAVKLNDRVAKDPAMNWKDFWPGNQQAATFNGDVIGVPALVDNLAVVYNKGLLAKAGLPEPRRNWTWDDFRRYAKAMTAPKAGQFGMAFPADGTENTTWRYEPLLWQAGGSILSKDGKSVAYNAPQGVQALQTLGQMAQRDKSVFVDTSGDKSEELFNAGKVGLFITGPWDLPQFGNVKYGVQTLPSFPGRDDHETISGPDNWVVLKNGNARVNAAYRFLQWLAAPDQVMKFSLATGDLPTRQSLAKNQTFMKQFNAKLPGLTTFVQNMADVKQSRPATVGYTKASDALSQAISAVLLGKSQPAPALSDAAKQANSALAGG